MEVTTIEEFNNAVSSKKFALVDFYADWCGPCKKLGKELHNFEANLSENSKLKFNLIKVNVDSAQELSDLYMITSLPTLKLFQDGKEIMELLGYSSSHIKNIKEKII
jgi:thioredoxin 1